MAVELRSEPGMRVARLGPALQSVFGRIGAGRREACVWMVGDATMRRLNRTYRRRRGLTDVLAFPQSGAQLGDVAVCLPEARRVARRSGTSVRGEALTLAVHGLLHLAGLDHHRSSGYARMQREESRLLRPFGLESGLARARREVR